MIPTLFFRILLSLAIVLCSMIQLFGDTKDSLLLAIDTASTVRIELFSKLDLSGYYIENAEHDTATVIIQQVIDKSDRLGEEGIKAKAYWQLGYNYDYAGNLEKSINNYEKARLIYEAVGDKENVALCMHSKGLAEYFQGDYEAALGHYLETLEYTEGLDFKKQRANTLNNLGVLYRISEKNEEAIGIYKEALTINRQLGDLDGVARQHNNLGVAYTYLYDLDSALLYLDSAMIRCQAVKDTFEIAFLYNSYGDAYYEAGKDLENARINLLKANELFQLSNNQTSLAKNYLFLGEVELESNNLAEAIKYLMDGLDVLEGTDREDIRLDIYDSLQKAYSSSGQNDVAFEYLTKHRALNNTLNADEKVKYIEEMQTKYETEKKEKLIAIQDIELEQQKKDNRNLGIILGLLALSLVSSALYIWNMVKSRNLIASQKNTIEKSLEEKEILLKEIHHRVKNNLQIISSLLTLQGRNANNPLIEEAIKKGKDRVRSMALIHENLYKNENFAGVNMKDYMEKLFTSLFNSYNINGDKIQLELNIQDLQLDVETVIPIGLAVNELITNALKYAFPDNSGGTLVVSLEELNKQLVLTVSDNGIGIQEGGNIDVQSGFGFELIKAFQSQLDAKLEVDSGHGTSVKLKMNNYKIDAA